MVKLQKKKDDTTRGKTQKKTSSRTKQKSTSSTGQSVCPNKTWRLLQGQLVNHLGQGTRLSQDQPDKQGHQGNNLKTYSQVPRSDCLFRCGVTRTNESRDYSRRPDPRIRQRIQIETIRPIRMDHTNFFKWPLKLIHSYEGHEWHTKTIFYCLLWNDKVRKKLVWFIVKTTCVIYYFTQEII